MDAVEAEQRARHYHTINLSRQPDSSLFPPHTPGMSAPSVKILQFTSTGNLLALNSSIVCLRRAWGVSCETHRAGMLAAMKQSAIALAAPTVAQKTKVDFRPPARCE
jgi:hypothetical protein